MPEVQGQHARANEKAACWERWSPYSAPAPRRKVDQEVKHKWTFYGQPQVERSWKTTSGEFACTELTFLGHVVSGECIKPSPAKTATIRAFPLPTTLKQIQAWLGLCNWYRRFIRGFAELAAPWVELTKKENVGEIATRVRQPPCLESFEKLKDALCGAEVMLLQPDHQRPFRVETDASNYQIGAVLTQQHPETGDWKPVEYYSRRLTAAEYGQRHTPSYLEAIAVFEGCRRWRIYLADKESFDVITDHSPLAALPTKKFALDRLTRIQMALQSYNYQVVYRQGSDHVVADALSRILIPVEGEGPDPADDIPVCPNRTLEQYLKDSMVQGVRDREEEVDETEEEPVVEFTLPGKKEGRVHANCSRVHCAAYTRSARAAQVAKELHEEGERASAGLATEEDGYVGRFVRKRIGASWHVGTVKYHNPEEGLYHVDFPEAEDTEDMTEEKLLAHLLPKDAARWPQPLLAGVGEEELGGSAPTFEEVPEEEEEEGVEVRMVTPCRILPGFARELVPSSSKDCRYLEVPNDAELLLAQKADPWCQQVWACLAELQGINLSGPARSEEVLYSELTRYGLLRPEAGRWYICQTTGLLMREGFLHEQVQKRRRKRKGREDQEVSVVETGGPEGHSLAKEAEDREQRAVGRRTIPQRIIPVGLRPNLLYFYHGHPLAGHKGVVRVRNEMSKKVWWPGLTQDLRRHIEGCKCAKGYRELKQPRPKLIKSLLQEAPSFGKHLSIDCSARGPESRRGNTAFLVIVDTHSLYTKVVPLPVVNALEVARALIEEWFLTHGLPVTLHSDGGSEFMNALLQNISQQLRITRTHISPGNPSGNTMAENAVKKMKAQIQELINDNFETWDQYVSGVTWSYNSSWNPRTGMIPMAVAFGQLPRGVIDLAMPDLVEERDSMGRPREAWTDYRTTLMNVLEKANLWVRQCNEEAMRRKKGDHEQGKFGYRVQKHDSVWYYNPVVKSRIQRQKQYMNKWKGPYLVERVSNTGNTAVLRMEGGTRLKSVNVNMLRQYRTPLMSTYGAANRVLAARPVAVLAHRQKGDDRSEHYYLTQLHSDTEFQEWVPADLLPEHMVLEWWRHLSQNPHLKGYRVGEEVTVLMPYHKRRLLQGKIVHRWENLLTIAVGHHTEVEAYVTSEGVVRSAEATTETDGRDRDQETRRQAQSRRRAREGGESSQEGPTSSQGSARYVAPEVGILLDRVLEDTGKAAGARNPNRCIIDRCADINGSTFQQLQDQGYEYTSNQGERKLYTKTDLRYDLMAGYLKYVSIAREEPLDLREGEGIDSQELSQGETLCWATRVNTNRTPIVARTPCTVLPSLSKDLDMKAEMGRDREAPRLPDALKWPHHSSEAREKNGKDYPRPPETFRSEKWCACWQVPSSMSWNRQRQGTGSWRFREPKLETVGEGTPSE